MRAIKTFLLETLPLNLSLALLVLRVGANHAHHPAPVKHFALVANLFYRCSYFHDPLPLLPPKTDATRGRLKDRPTCSGRRCARASNRKAKAPRLLCLPLESG